MLSSRFQGPPQCRHDPAKLGSAERKQSATRAGNRLCARAGAYNIRRRTHSVTGTSSARFLNLCASASPSPLTPEPMLPSEPGDMKDMRAARGALRFLSARSQSRRRLRVCPSHTSRAPGARALPTSTRWRQQQANPPTNPVGTSMAGGGKRKKKMNALRESWNANMISLRACIIVIVTFYARLASVAVLPQHPRTGPFTGVCQSKFTSTTFHSAEADWARNAVEPGEKGEDGCECAACVGSPRALDSMRLRRHGESRERSRTPAAGRQASGTGAQRDGHAGGPAAALTGEANSATDEAPRRRSAAPHIAASHPRPSNLRERTVEPKFKHRTQPQTRAPRSHTLDGKGRGTVDDTAHGSKTCRILSPHASDVERIRDRSGRKASGNVDPTGQQDTSSRIRSPKRPVMPPSSISVPSGTKTVVASPAASSTPPATDGIGLAPQVDVKCVALRMEPGDDICQALRAASGGRSMFVLSCVGSVSAHARRQCTRASDAPIPPLPRAMARRHGTRPSCRAVHAACTRALQTRSTSTLRPYTHTHACSWVPTHVYTQVSNVGLRLAGFSASEADDDASATSCPLTFTSKYRFFGPEHHFEIVSLSGSICGDGGLHLHMSMADNEGRVVGGHLKYARVWTTAELLLGVLPAGTRHAHPSRAASFAPFLAQLTVLLAIGPGRLSA